MKPNDDRARPVTADAPAPRRRFRIEKLEERIAPKKKGGGSNSGSSASGTSIRTMPY